jgi:hypothetical protein
MSRKLLEIKPPDLSEASASLRKSTAKELEWLASFYKTRSKPKIAPKKPKAKPVDWEAKYRQAEAEIEALKRSLKEALDERDLLRENERKKAISKHRRALAELAALDGETL